MDGGNSGTLLSRLRTVVGIGAPGLPPGSHENPLKSESEQSAVRFGFAVIFTGIGWWTYNITGAGDLPWTVLPYIAVYIAYSAVCLWHVRLWPGFNPWRLALTTVLDPLLVTIILFAGGDRTVPLIWAYYWFVTAQGVRYGTPWMLLSAVTTFIAVAALTRFEPSWRQHAAYGLGVILSLASVTVFLSVANLRLSSLQLRLIKMASHDPLTGVANRTRFYDALRQALWRCERYKQHLAVLSIDLDGFKAVNDVLGHQAGDHVLKSFATQISAALRREDVIARIGGDEFVILLENINGQTIVRRISNLILSTLANINEFEGQRLAVSASIGIATYPFIDMPDQVTPDHLLNRADAAMYRAKADGKNRTSLDGNALLGDGPG